MASAANRSAISAPSSYDKAAPSLQSQRPGVHSVLAAVMGLTSLGAPSSPNKVSPSPTGSIEIKMGPNMENNSTSANKARSTQTSQPHAKDKNLAVDNQIATTMLLPPGSTSASINSHAPLIWSPKARSSSTLYPAAPSAPRLSIFKNPTPRPFPPTRILPAGFGTFRAPSNPYPTTRFSKGAMGMDLLSTHERISVINTAPVAIPSPARPSFSYNTYQHSVTPPPPPSTLAPLAVPRRTKSFPETLLEVISIEAHSDIISWLPHGRGFAILDKQRFAGMILPRYFDGAKFTSFTRRLKRWNFIRVPRGHEMGAYYNKNFVRNRPELVQNMSYQMDGKFEEGKKKKTKKTNEEERKGEKSLPEIVRAQLNVEPPRLASQDEDKKQQQLHVISAMPSPRLDDWHFTNPQDRPMPLPSMLLKRPKLTTSHKKMSRPVGNSTNKHVDKATTIRQNKNMKCLEDRATMAESTLLSGKYVDAGTSNDFSKSRAIDNQSESMLAGSILPHEVTGRGSRSGPASTPGNSNISNATGRRPVLMSRKEEEEFAGYLIMKMKNYKGAQHHK